MESCDGQLVADQMSDRLRAKSNSYRAYRLSVALRRRQPCQPCQPCQRLALLLLALVAAGALWLAGPAAHAQGAHGADDPTTSNGCPITADQQAAEQYLLGVLNQHRADVGVAPLTLDDTLSSVARDHSCDMFLTQTANHTGSDGTSPSDRMDAAGVIYNTWGENIGDAWGFASITDALDYVDAQMMAEPVDEPYNHHWNIVNVGYTTVGLGVIAANGQVWFTEDFIG